MIAECFYEAMQAISRLVPERPLPKPLATAETDKWRLAVNTTGENVAWDGDGYGAEIGPYSVAAINKEFVAMAMFDVGGGTIAGGMTEDQFIDEMKAIASVDTLPKGQDAKQGLAGTESGAVPSETSADAQPKEAGNRL